MLQQTGFIMFKKYYKHVFYLNISDIFRYHTAHEALLDIPAFGVNFFTQLFPGVMFLEHILFREFAEN